MTPFPKRKSFLVAFLFLFLGVWIKKTRWRKITQVVVSSASNIVNRFSRHTMATAITILFIVLFFGTGRVLGQITQVVGSPQTNTTTGTRLTIAKPSGLAVGDVMIVQIVQGGDNNGVFSLNDATIPDWTVVTGSNIRRQNKNYCRATILYKVATSSDVSATNYAFTLDYDSDDGEGAIVAFSGVDATNPFDITPATEYDNISNDNTLNANAITIATNNSALLMFGALADNINISNWTSGLTELYDVPFDATIDMGMGAAVEYNVVTGSTGNKSAGLNYYYPYNGSVLIALKPAPKYYQSVTSGDWNNISTWQESDDNITWIAAASTPTSNAQGITIQSSHTVYATSTPSYNNLVVYGTYEHRMNGGTIPTATWEENSTCYITGATSTAPGGYNQIFWNFAWECTGQSTYLALGTIGSVANRASMSVQGDLTVAATGNRETNVNNDFNIEGDITVGGNFIINESSSASYAMYRLCYGEDRTLTVNGDVIITGGELAMNTHASSGSSTGTLYVKGNFTHTSGTISNDAGNGKAKIIFNGSYNGTIGMQTYTSGGIFDDGGNNNGHIDFIVNNGAYLQMGTGASPATIPSTNSGTFTLSSGGTLGVTSTAGITTSGATGNIQSTGTRTFSTGANYIYNGTSSQVTGNGLPATVNVLKINNSGGSTGVTMTGNVTVNSTLNLTNGLLTTTDSYLVTVASSGAVTNASSNSYVNGKLSRIYNSTGSKDFAIGKGGNYCPLTLYYTSLTGTSTVTAEQFETSISGTLPDNTTLFTDRYWNISQTGGSSFTYSLTLDGTGFAPEADPVILKDGAIPLNNYPATQFGNNYTASGLTSFSNFALGSKCSPPIISVQPGPLSQTVCEGSSVTYSVTASSGGPGTISYQWKKGTTNVGTNSSTLTLNSVSVSDAGEYSVTVTRTCGSSLTSDVVVLNVEPTPVITTQPASIAICPGDDIDLTVTSSSGNPIYQWQSSTDGTSWSYVTSAFDSNPVFFASDFSSTPANANVYSPASVTDGYLQLTPPTGSLYGGFVIQSTPGVNLTAFDVNFDYRIYDGTGADGFSLSYGPDIANNSGSGEEGEGSGIIVKFDTYDNNAGNTNSQIRIDYNNSQIWSNTVGDFDLRNPVYQNVDLYVDQSGNLSLSIGETQIVSNLSVAGFSSADKSNWKFKFSGRTGGLNDAHRIDNLRIQYGNNPILTVSPATTMYYRAVVNSGTCSVTTNTATVTVNPVTTITSQPSTGNQTICLGETANSLSVTATGTGTLAYQWYSNTSNSNSGGSLISGATSNSYTPLTVTSGKLYYYCIITGTCGTATSDPSGAITINALPAAPTANNVTTIYDGTVKTASATAGTGEIIDWYTSETGSTIASAPSGTDVGTYTAWAEARNTTTGCLSDTRTQVTLTVTKRPVTITADNKQKNCGDTEPVLTYQVTSGSVISGDNFSGSLTRESGEALADYDIQQGTLVLNSNYILTFIPATFTISDTENPVANCISNLTVDMDENGEAVITPDMINNGSTDNCGIDTMWVSPKILSCTGESGSGYQSVVLHSNNDLFSVKITITNLNVVKATYDGSGSGFNYDVKFDYNVEFFGADTPGSLNNFSVTIGCTQNYTQSYVSTPPLQGTSQMYGGYVGGVSQSYYDNFTISSLNCTNVQVSLSVNHNGELLSVSNEELSYYSSGSSSQNVTLTVVDNSGNTNTCTTAVTLNDAIAPVPDVTTLPDVTADCEVSTLTAPTASDNCAGSITATHNATLPITAQGTTVVTWTYDDGNGSTSKQTQNVVINDDTDPTITCPTDINQSVDPGSCNATNVSLVIPVTADNCGIASVTNNAPASFSLGTTVVTWTATDIAGNPKTCTQNVTIVPEEDIDISVEDLGTSCQSGETGSTTTIIWDITKLTGTDNWSFDYQIKEGSVTVLTMSGISATGNTQVSFDADNETAQSKTFTLTIFNVQDSCGSEESITTNNSDSVTLLGVPATSDINTN